jgi:hypothetical protein
LNPQPPRSIPRAQEQEHPMLALGIIIGFVVVVGAINYFEFGRVD